MKGVQHIDTTGLLTLEGVIEHRLRGGRRTILTALDPSMSLILQRFGIIDLVGHENVFAATRDAIASVPPPGSERRESDFIVARTRGGFTHELRIKSRLVG